MIILTKLHFFREGLDMNRIILITVFLLAIASITSGNLYWSKQQEATINKAKLTLKNVQAAEASQPKEENVPSKKDIVEDKKANSSNEKTKDDEIVDSGKEEAKTSNDLNKKSLPEIKEYYLSLFDELEVQETSKADQLLVQAKADQVSGTYSKTELADKYQDLSKQLEQNSDQTFNVLYEALHADLSKNGHSTSAAKEFKTAYNTKKQERIERILKKLNKM